MIARLIPTDGSAAIEIARDITLVGRKAGLCDIVLPNHGVSKLHCALAKTDGLLFLRDLGSTNGTKVNGQRVVRGALLPGDELAFGSIKFRVFLGPGQPAAGHHDRTEMIPAREPPAEDPIGALSVSFNDDDDSDNEIRLIPQDDPEEEPDSDDDSLPK